MHQKYHKRPTRCPLPAPSSKQRETTTHINSQTQAQGVDSVEKVWRPEHASTKAHKHESDVSDGCKYSPSTRNVISTSKRRWEMQLHIFRALAMGKLVGADSIEGGRAQHRTVQCSAGLVRETSRVNEPGPSMASPGTHGRAREGRVKQVVNEPTDGMCHIRQLRSECTIGSSTPCLTMPLPFSTSHAWRKSVQCRVSATVMVTRFASTQPCIWAHLAHINASFHHPHLLLTSRSLPPADCPARV